MNTGIAIALIGAAAFALGTLLALTWQGRRLHTLIEDERHKNAVFAKIFHQVDDQLTSVKWHTEMLMDQQGGKLNIAQQQMLHRVDTSVADAISLLKGHFGISSHAWKQEKHSRGETS